MYDCYVNTLFYDVYVFILYINKVKHISHCCCTQLARFRFEFSFLVRFLRVFLKCDHFIFLFLAFFCFCAHIFFILAGNCAIDRLERLVSVVIYSRPIIRLSSGMLALLTHSLWRLTFAVFT